MLAVGLMSPSLSCTGVRSSACIPVESIPQRSRALTSSFRGADVHSRRSTFAACVPRIPTGQLTSKASPVTAKKDADKKSHKGKKHHGIGTDLGSDYVDIPHVPTARRAGVIMHPTSLPGRYGIGELGVEAFQFVDWLRSAGASAWQVLPLVPPGRRPDENGLMDWSPYNGQDAFCGNTLLISLERLVEDGLLESKELPPHVPVRKVDFSAVAAVKEPLLIKAADRLLSGEGSKGCRLKKMNEFREDASVSAWLEDAALFYTIDAHMFPGKDWWEWPAELRDRKPKALAKVREELSVQIDRFVALQFLFQRQWRQLREYANDNGVKIIGDIPIYVGGHSADVWSSQHLWQLDRETGKPLFVSGVPPDAFSATGQLWGSPLYDWQAHADEKFAWWGRRLGRAMDLHDEVRIDHFRGLAGYYSIAADAETAMDGTWCKGPGEELFKGIQSIAGDVNIIAEDLGIITPDVTDLRMAINAPGMRVLLFGWGGSFENEHLPHNYDKNCVAYPGTHDNDTVEGWYKTATTEQKLQVGQYLSPPPGERISWAFLRGVLASAADTAIVSMQDILSLDNSARMNIPSTKSGNWSWRLSGVAHMEDLAEEAAKFRQLVVTYGREQKVEDKKKDEEEGAEKDKEKKKDKGKGKGRDFDEDCEIDDDEEEVRRPVRANSA
eukprot:jgi/Mesvir1/3331/Mv13716-RA.1